MDDFDVDGSRELSEQRSSTPPLPPSTRNTRSMPGLSRRTAAVRARAAKREEAKG